MNDIKVFENIEFGKLEVLWENGKEYFPAKRCAEILGYSNPHEAVRRHCKGCVKRSLLTNGGKQEKKFISEGDLYRLIVRSKLESAQRFESYVFDEVLPTIRKYGMYANAEVLKKMICSPENVIQICTMLVNEQKKNKKLEADNAKLAEKCGYLDKILQSKNAIPVTVIAKDYGMSAQVFNDLLHFLGIQYKLKSGTWVLYQKYADCGYTKSKTYQYDEDKTTVHTYWTQSGRIFLYDYLKKYGYLPVCERQS